MRMTWKVAAIAAMVVASGANMSNAQTFTWNLPGSGDWSDPASWSPTEGAPPNGTDVEVHFNGNATADNPDQNNGTRTATLNGDFTIGHLLLNEDRYNHGSNFAQTMRDNIGPGADINTGNPGTLTFDVSSGDATIFVPRTQAVNPGTGVLSEINTINQITADVIFNDNVVATTDSLGTSSFDGVLEFRGAISGPGGFTKTGAGLANFNHESSPAQSKPKTYTGPTLLANGRLRMDNLSYPSATSSFTITGGQLEINDQSGGFYTFGPGNLILAGAGPNGSGAIRPSRSTTSGSIITITNNIVVQATTVLHSQTQNDISQGSITLTGNISGDGGAQLQFTAPNSNNQIGTYIIQGANNTYSGGTLLRGGALTVSSALSSSASLGAGNVTIENHPETGTARSVLTLESGLTNAIGDAATLSLAGGGVPGVADTGYVDLGFGINETVGGLLLGGVAQPAGTYGATGSGATFLNDEYFAGAGVITVAPSIPGDFNHNGMVNSDDLVIWKDHFGADNGADADGDGDTDGGDFLLWQQNVGMGSSVAAASAVPEPAAALLLTVAGLALVSRRRER